MALNRLNREIEDAARDGNCAFNAFALALCDEYTLYLIERSLQSKHQNPDVCFHQFILAVAEVFNIPANWKEVKQELLQCRKTNKVGLQKKLAPVLRNLCIDLAEDPARYVYHQNLLYSHFLEAFSQYRNRSEDDLFARHQFIKHKFYEVIHSTDSEIQQDKTIDQWWWKEGYQQFLKAMRSSGVWAGDLELTRLAEYFNVVLHIFYEEEDYGIHGNYGYLPLLDQEVFKDCVDDIYFCLYSRGVIERETTEINQVLSHPFKLTNYNQLSMRLSRIRDYPIVLSFIEANDNLKGLAVPDGWSLACLNELIHRNVIGRGRDGKSYVFLQQAGPALSEINEVPCYAQVMKLCQAHFQQHACLVLRKIDECNGHWQNTQLKLTENEKFYQRVAVVMHDNPATQFFLQQPLLRRSAENPVKRHT